MFHLYVQKSRKDVSNFDREFTSEAPKLTPTDKLFIMNLDQTEFSGFSYVNPEFVVTVWVPSVFAKVAVWQVWKRSLFMFDFVTCELSCWIA